MNKIKTFFLNILEKITNKKEIERLKVENKKLQRIYSKKILKLERENNLLKYNKLYADKQKKGLRKVNTGEKLW